MQEILSDLEPHTLKKLHADIYVGRFAKDTWRFLAYPSIVSEPHWQCILNFTNKGVPPVLRILRA